MEPFVLSILARSLQCEKRTIYSLSELTRLPLQWSDVATLIDTDFCNMHKRVTQLKRCEAADQESVAVLLFQN